MTGKGGAKGGQSARPLIAITTGEPAGIGPDIALMFAARRSAWRGTQLLLIGDASLLEVRARRLGLNAQEVLRGVELGHVPLRAPVRAGKLDPRNAAYVLATLDAGLAGCVHGQFAAMVTAPVHKGVINDAGIAFTGHTEYFAAHTNSKHVVMLLTGKLPRAARVDAAAGHDRDGGAQGPSSSRDMLRVALACRWLMCRGH